MLETLTAIGAVWISCGLASWISITHYRMEKFEFEVLFDLSMILVCFTLGPFLFWIAEDRLVGR